MPWRSAGSGWRRSRLVPATPRIYPGRWIARRGGSRRRIFGGGVTPRKAGGTARMPCRSAVGDGGARSAQGIAVSPQERPCIAALSLFGHTCGTGSKRHDRLESSSASPPPAGRVLSFRQGLVESSDPSCIGLTVPSISHSARLVRANRRAGFQLSGEPQSERRCGTLIDETATCGDFAARVATSGLTGLDFPGKERLMFQNISSCRWK